MTPDGRTAVGDAFGRHRRYLVGVARAALGPRLRAKVDPSDVVQQALLRAYRHRGRFRGHGEAAVAGWLRQILVNQVRAVGRAFATAARDAGREGPALDKAEVACGDTSPSRRAERAEQVDRLTAALARLPADQRTAVDLHHLRGLPVADVAERMGKTKQAVVGLLYRGLTNLRADLTDGAAP